MIADPRVEDFLNVSFANAAKEMEERQKGKTYQYKLRKEYCGIPDMSGKCLVLSRECDRGLDCDVLRCRDVDTGKIFSCNQFQLEIEECA